MVVYIIKRAYYCYNTKSSLLKLADLGNMMGRYIVLIGCLVMMCLASFAQGSTGMMLGDKEYSLHRVAPSETFYSIAKTYDVLVDSLKAVNRMDSTATLHPGDLLIIPLYASKKADIGSVVPSSPEQYIIHVVKTGETLYSIVRKYSYTTLDVIKKLNGLGTNDVQIGQQLKIPKPGDQGLYTPPKIDSLSGVGVVQQSIDSAALFDPGMFTGIEEDVDSSSQSMISAPGYDVAMLEGLTLQFEQEDSLYANAEVTRGAALWLDDPSEQNQQKFYALHKSVPMGAVIQVRNLMNDRVVFVKVIGKLPESSQNKNVIIQLSGAAAKYLNVLDNKFLVEVTAHPDRS